MKESLNLIRGSKGSKAKAAGKYEREGLTAAVVVER
jgi:hypothetical protein